jgi:cyclopropane-fatty-acyl-phospholipid synthase
MSHCFCFFLLLILPHPTPVLPPLHHRYVNGVNYSLTLEAWLKKHDAERTRVYKVLAETYGASQATVWFNRWRMFYIACSELFAYDRGNEWGVGHYVFQKK